MTKQEIRRKILDMRKGLTSKYIEDESERIYERLTESKILDGAKNVLIYSDFDGEVKTAALTGWMMYHGMRIFLPCIDCGDMHAADIKSAALELSAFGIAQPRFSDAQMAEPGELDAVIVPGIAFDRQKNRIGFGKGYYDAYLAQAVNAKKVALAYDFQIVDHIPGEKHDIRMDMIITPDGIIR